MLIRWRLHLLDRCSFHPTFTVFSEPIKRQCFGSVILMATQLFWLMKWCWCAKSNQSTFDDSFNSHCFQSCSVFPNISCVLCCFQVKVAPQKMLSASAPGPNEVCPNVHQSNATSSFRSTKIYLNFQMVRRLLQTSPLL